MFTQQVLATFGGFGKPAIQANNYDGAATVLYHPPDVFEIATMTKRTYDCGPLSGKVLL